MTEIMYTIIKNPDGSYTAILPNGCAWTFNATDMQDAERKVDDYITAATKRKAFASDYISLGGTKVRKKAGIANKVRPKVGSI